MQTSSAQFTIAEYVKQMKSGDVRVNKDYQRSSTVWPAAARSYLIDTILKGFPVPKLSLYQKTDLKKKTTIKEIVDGQQRSHAIRDFLEGKLRITGHSEFKGCTYDQLDAEYQERFLAYPLTCDIFAAATDSEIREVFRRINSYNVALNKAEARHARFQGEFKWFIVDMCERHSQVLKDLGVFSESQLSRMADATLFTEIVYTWDHGIDHASETKLESLYRKYDESFVVAKRYRNAIGKAIDIIVSWGGLHGTALMKSYAFYSAITAIGHVLYKFDTLESIYAAKRAGIAGDAEDNVATLMRALEENDTEGKYKTFVIACSEQTNRKVPREIRFKWFSKAIAGKYL